MSTSEWEPQDAIAREKGIRVEAYYDEEDEYETNSVANQNGQPIKENTSNVAPNHTTNDKKTKIMCCTLM